MNAEEEQRRTDRSPAHAARDILDLSPARLKILALELQSRLIAYEDASREPVAIIGMAGRYPGAGETLDDFWALLAAQRVAEPARPETESGAAATRVMTLAGVDQFDPGFFGISSDDARFMDPQHRLIVEAAWLAMENAGRTPDDIGRRTGVYIAICSTDYAEVVRSSNERWPGRLVQGNSHSLAAGRLSRMFGFTGPSMALDSACSSSLLAAHLAIGHLRARECEAALVAGVSCILSKSVTEDLRQTGLLSPSGVCRPFDAKADGYIRGEGCGVLILKRFSDAQRDGDRIIAIIRGSAMNHDAGGMMLAPYGPAQREVMRMALDNAAVDPAEIDYLEASSIGAWLADPVEVEAIGAIYGERRRADCPLHIGSAKANVGHLEAAAGVAALTKAALCLQHQSIPGHATFDAPNPHIDFAESWFIIPRKTLAATALPNGALRLAAVSGFSLSGTNVHIILERAPTSRPTSLPEQLCVLPLSAKEPAALEELTKRTIAWLKENPEKWPDLCYTMAVGRKQMRYRRVIVARNTAAAAAKLGEIVDPPHLSVGEPPSIAFIFAPAGPTADALDQLAAHEPLFANAMQDGAKAWRKVCGLPPTENAPAEEAPARVRQFLSRVALLRLVEAAGIKPAAVGGVKDGEIIAALAAGLFELEDALRLLAGEGAGIKITFRSERIKILSALAEPSESRGPLASDSYWNGLRSGNLAHLLVRARSSAGQVLVFGEHSLRIDGAAHEIAFHTPGAVVELAAELYRLGFALNWRQLLRGKGRRIVEAPVTAFTRQSYWIGKHGTSVVPTPPNPPNPQMIIPSMSREQATELLIALLRQELSLDELRPDDNLLQQGASSVELMQTILRIEQLTGFRPQVSDLYANPTVNDLVDLFLRFQAGDNRGVTCGKDNVHSVDQQGHIVATEREVGWI